jgi:hypothetical protein
VKAVQKFLADDGTQFDTEHDAMQHESLCQEIWRLMQKLRPLPDLPHCEFANGAGYVQQIPADFLHVQAELARIAQRSFPSGNFSHHFDHAINATKPAGHTFIGRLMDDGCPSPVSRAWNRIMCTDDQFREWGQPYYAMHPEKATQRCFSGNGRASSAD